MATTDVAPKGSLVLVITALCVLLMNSSGCYGFNRKTLNVQQGVMSNNATLVAVDAVTSVWAAAGATWYGASNGYGSDGGACGYGADVGTAPFSSLISAGGPSLFLVGLGCGTCYQVRCSSNAACSGNPVTVVITDSCLGGVCVTDATHFDLSGTAFGAMATSGQADALRNVGNLAIEYRRVECSYSGTSLTFKVVSGSNPYYFALLIEYVSGDGDIAEVELMQTSVSTTTWLSMQQSWGAIWKLNSGTPLQGPFSIRITNAASETVAASNVIPANWAVGVAYPASVNF